MYFLSSCKGKRLIIVIFCERAHEYEGTASNMLIITYLNKDSLHFQLVREDPSVGFFYAFKFKSQFAAFLCSGGKLLAQKRDSVLFKTIMVIAAHVLLIWYYMLG